MCHMNVSEKNVIRKVQVVKLSKVQYSGRGKKQYTHARAIMMGAGSAAGPRIIHPHGYNHVSPRRSVHGNA